MRKISIMAVVLGIVATACDSGNYEIRNLDEVLGQEKLNEIEQFKLKCMESGGLIVDSKPADSGNVNVGDGEINRDGGEADIASDEGNAGTDGSNPDECQCQCGNFLCNEGVICAEEGTKCNGDGIELEREKDKCKRLESRCEGSSIQLCYGDGDRVADWMNVYTCPFGCSSNGKDCLDDPNKCQESDTKCYNREDSIGVPMICKDGHWVFGECDNKSCNEIGSGCGICKNGSSYCEENEEGVGSIITCVKGYWGETELCGSSTNPLSCDENKSGCGVCRNGDTDCINNVGNIGFKSICNKGSWSGEDCKDEDNLPVSCNSSEKDCGSCINGIVDSCITGIDHLSKQKLCLRGANRLMDCPRLIIGEDEVAGQCTDERIDRVSDDGTEEYTGCRCAADTFSCTNNADGIGVLQSCGKDGIWGEGVECGNVSCDNNNCGECKNGEKRCRDDEYGVGIKETCQLGVWVADSTDQCSGDVSCSGLDCGVCLNGTSYCTENEQAAGNLTTCINGELVDLGCTNDKNSITSCSEDKKSCGKCLNGSTTEYCVNGSDGIGRMWCGCNNGEIEESNCKKTCPGSCGEDLTCNQSQCVDGTIKCSTTNALTKLEKEIGGSKEEAPKTLAKRSASICSFGVYQKLKISTDKEKTTIVQDQITHSNDATDGKRPSVGQTFTGTMIEMEISSLINISSCTGELCLSGIKEKEDEYCFDGVDGRGYVFRFSRYGSAANEYCYSLIGMCPKGCSFESGCISWPSF